MSDPRRRLVQPGSRPDTSVTVRPETWVTLWSHALGRDRCDGRATAIRNGVAEAEEFVQEPVRRLRRSSKDGLQVAAPVRYQRTCRAAGPLPTAQVQWPGNLSAGERASD